MTYKIKNFIILLTLFLSGCSMNIIEYEDNSPKLDIREYFQGKVRAYGVLQSFTGKITRRFSVEMDGTFSDNIGELNEIFFYDDGEKQMRIWNFEIIDEHNFIGTAPDVKGIAKGKQYGNAVNMKYDLIINYKGKDTVFAVDDWLYLVDETNLINISKVKKFGVTVAKLAISFHKE